MLSRRSTLKGMALAGAASLAPPAALAGAASGARHYASNQTRRWLAQPAPTLASRNEGIFKRSFSVSLDTPAQTIEGFGGCFSEKGWEALSTLPPASRAKALDALFGGGANFNLCRTPIGANDITRDFYSYDEVDGDFGLAHFSIDKDKQTLLPFIHEALKRRPDLKLWASPWSPPTWMKKNKHYAQSTPWQNGRPNGVRPDQVMREGVDGFIQDDRYFTTYAQYFRRYVEAYRAEGVEIGLVMPQNEFNSPHPFPGCVWTAEGLIRFLPFLHEAVSPLGVKIFLGTLERDKPEIVDAVMADPKSAAIIEGVGVQWAGKNALEEIRARHPALRIWGSEQECGVGANDWRYARYGWKTMMKYFQNGASAWQYWNIAMPADGMSGWGWPQNALISVDGAARTCRLTHDYWVLRHLSAHVKPGARFLPTFAGFGYENQLAFRNPDGELVLVIHNDLADPDHLHIGVGGKQIDLTLPADSFNTVLIPAAWI